MRADKDYKTYEQALTIVQRFGEQAEADHKRGKHQDAQYNLAHATFVGVKHLLFMAADAAVDRAEAREMAAKNHLEMIELLSLTLVSLGDDNDSDEEDMMPRARAAKAQRRSAGLDGKAIKTAKVDKSSDIKKPTTQAGPFRNGAMPGKKTGPRVRRL
jgi:hypothetical protein